MTTYDNVFYSMHEYLFLYGIKKTLSETLKSRINTGFALENAYYKGFVKKQLPRGLEPIKKAP